MRTLEQLRQLWALESADAAETIAATVAVDSEYQNVSNYYMATSFDAWLDMADALSYPGAHTQASALVDQVVEWSLALLNKAVANGGIWPPATGDPRGHFLNDMEILARLARVAKFDANVRDGVIAHLDRWLHPTVGPNYAAWLHNQRNWNNKHFHFVRILAGLHAAGVTVENRVTTGRLDVDGDVEAEIRWFAKRFRNEHIHLAYRGADNRDPEVVFATVASPDVAHAGEWINCVISCNGIGFGFGDRMVDWLVNTFKARVAYSDAGGFVHFNGFHDGLSHDADPWYYGRAYRGWSRLSEFDHEIRLTFDKLLTQIHARLFHFPTTLGNSGPHARAAIVAALAKAALKFDGAPGPTPTDGPSDPPPPQPLGGPEPYNR